MEMLGLGEDAGVITHLDPGMLEGIRMNENVCCSVQLINKLS